jgi:hypothetical protein
LTLIFFVQNVCLGDIVLVDRGDGNRVMAQLEGRGWLNGKLGSENLLFGVCLIEPLSKYAGRAQHSGTVRQGLLAYAFVLCTVLAVFLDFCRCQLIRFI